MSNGLKKKNKKKTSKVSFPWLQQNENLGSQMQNEGQKRSNGDLGDMRRFVSRMEELGRRPKNAAFQEDFLALLKDGYEKDLEILCPGITDPADRSMAKQGNVTLDDGSKYLLCVTKMAYGSVFFMSGLSVQDMMIRDVIDRVLDSNVYAGLLFDYKAPTGSFYIKKQDLRRVIRGA